MHTFNLIIPCGLDGKNDSNKKDSSKMTDQIPQMQLVEAKHEPSVGMMLSGLIESVQKGETTPQTVEVLKGMMDLYERNQAKVSEREFNQAFAKLQSELRSVNATRTVPNKDGSPRYRFAPFEDIMEEVQPVLVANGFSISFNSRFMEGGRMVSICTLRHIGGFSQSNEFAVRIGGGPPGATETQADGAAKTYAKRGALCDALNIVVEHDDDARMIGQPIGKALAEDLEKRVKAVGSDVETFLKYAGASKFEDISDEKWETLDAMLKRKEAAKAAREKLSPEGEWK
jgi:hypothetical protein